MTFDDETPFHGDDAPDETPFHGRTVSTKRVAAFRRRWRLGQQIVNGIRISDSEIEGLRNRGYEGDLVEAIETFLSDLLV